jgi:predicted CoA-substrate-specific enzyme activase
MIFAGLDIGSVATKAVVWDDRAGRVLASALGASGWEPRLAGEACLRDALGQAALSRGDLRGLVVTGYGRSLWREGGRTVTELTCLLHGARQVAPEVRTVFDVGGQDSKALALDAQGELVDFVINDRCAAGTGRFLEAAGLRLGLTVAELGALGAEAKETVRLSNICAVFAESEVVGLLAQGIERSTVARALCEAVAGQLLSLSGRLPRTAPLALVGGVGYNLGVQVALERTLEAPVYVPEAPQMVVALGAAILASQEE